MAAPKGNSFWKSRSKHGRDKLFATPGLLLESASDYFDWCDDNPWKKTKTKTGGMSGNVYEEEELKRPYTKGGWYHFIGCSDSWLKEFKKSADEDFLLVIEEIESFIATQQLEGATVGVFNSNIIARTLGLADKKEIDANVNTKPLSKEEIDNFNSEIENDV